MDGWSSRPLEISPDSHRYMVTTWAQRSKHTTFRAAIPLNYFPVIRPWQTSSMWRYNTIAEEPVRRKAFETSPAIWVCTWKGFLGSAQRKPYTNRHQTYQRISWDKLYIYSAGWGHPTRRVHALLQWIHGGTRILQENDSIGCLDARENRACVCMSEARRVTTRHRPTLAHVYN